MFGYDSTPRLRIDSTPAITIRIAITQAKTGWSMKIARHGALSPSAGGRRGRRGGCGLCPAVHGAAFAGCPGLHALQARHDHLVARRNAAG